MKNKIGNTVSTKILWNKFIYLMTDFSNKEIKSIKNVKKHNMHAKKITNGILLLIRKLLMKWW